MKALLTIIGSVLYLYYEQGMHTFSNCRVLPCYKDGGRARPGVTARWIRQVTERLGGWPYSPKIRTGDLNQGRPPLRAGDWAAPHLLYSRVLYATLFPCAAPIPTGLNTDATAFVLGLIELIVDDVLEHDEQDADEDREERDADVCLQVPSLQCVKADIRFFSHRTAICVLEKKSRAFMVLRVGTIGRTWCPASFFFENLDVQL
jgi:hypothetical protein